MLRFYKCVFFLCLVLRDMRRGRDLEQILTQYTTFVKPAFEEFCLPVRNHNKSWRITVLQSLNAFVTSDISLQKQTKKYADVIIPRGVDNMGKYEPKANEYSCIYTGGAEVWNNYHFISHHIKAACVYLKYGKTVKCYFSL